MELHKVIVSALLFAFLTQASTLFAQEREEVDDKGIFSIVLENDVFSSSDSDYTNGIRFSWISSEEYTPSWARIIARRLPLASTGNKRISIAAGQSMFTPEDITRRELIIGDHPYAGWLYGSVGMVSDTGKTLDNVMLTLGVVGPLSCAEQTQQFFHSVVKTRKPLGWDNQLENEPGIILTYERKWRGMYELSPFGMGVDVTPHIGVNLGNVNTDASLGATFRLGYDLPSDYGPPRIRPSLPGSDFFIPTKELGGYLFATAEGRAVGHNIFLDGNTFNDSPQVDKENLVGSLQVGVVVTRGQMRLSYSQVFMMKEYATQKHSPEFGTLTFSYRF